MSTTTFTKLRVGDGKGTPAVDSAALEIRSTSQGFMPPRMTTAERDANLTPNIGADEEGLLIYNLTTQALETWNGAAWA